MFIFTWFADYITYALFGLEKGTQLTGGVHFFIEDTSKILVLLAVMIYAISFIRAGLPLDKIKTFLNGRNRWSAYILAALLGAVTPFCSCSSIPIFLGFVSAGIPAGIAFAFLITSPMINEAAVVMLGGSVGWTLTSVYVIIGMATGVLGGAFFDAIKADRWITSVNHVPEYQGGEQSKPTLKERHHFAMEEGLWILGKIWIWVIAGIGLGAFLHGYVPDEWVGQHLNGTQWWRVPTAVALGIPVYANATGVIPVVGALIQKGLPIGTAFGFMLGTVALSLPEILMLKRVLSMKLLMIFIVYLLVFFTLCGWILNAVSFNLK